MLTNLKIGFIGAGNMAQTMIKGLTDSGAIKPEKIFVSNRSAGKLSKVVDSFHVQAANTNEQLIEASDVVVVAVKPQDLPAALESVGSIFSENQIVVSLAAGVSLKTLRKYVPVGRLVRAMPNTPAVLGRGVIGYCMANGKDAGAQSVMEALLKPLGYVIHLEEDEKFDALLVACASGTGFVFELMAYWQEWIEERGFDAQTARQMTVETFFGAALLAQSSPDASFEDLAAKVASKKGVTAAGLDSMRELEIERALRYSFEKADIRNKELNRNSGS